MATNPYLLKNKHLSKTTSLIICFLCYAIALAVGILTQHFFAYLGDIWSLLIADIAATFVIYILGLPFSNASLYDPYWSVAPIPIAIYWWSLSGFDLAINKILLLLVLAYWAVRLTLNWARGWTGFTHEDWRYGMLRQQNGRFYQFVNLSGIHLFPTVLVFLGMLPAYFILAFNMSANLLGTLFAFLFGIAAVTISLLADEQLKIFVKNNKIKGAFLQAGLWKYSRHPNYFGEIAMWTSLFLFAMASNLELWWTGIGWLSMFLLFWFISIPMMDKRMCERRPAYAEFMKRSSRLFLWRR